VAIEKIHVKQQTLNKTMLTDLYSLIQDSNFNSTTEEVAQAISALSINGFSFILSLYSSSLFLVDNLSTLSGTGALGFNNYSPFFIYHFSLLCCACFE